MCVDCDELRIVVQQYVEAACVVDLRQQAGIGERHRLTEHKWPGAGVLYSVGVVGLSARLARYTETQLARDLRTAAESISARISHD